MELQNESCAAEHYTNIHRGRLPVMAMCTEPDSIDLPVPDFAFEDYPDTGYVSASR